MVNLLRTFKFKLFPSSSQRRKLQASLDACRWVYNKSLEVRKNAWENDRSSVSLFDTRKMLTTWFIDEPWLRNAHSQTLQQAQGRVQLAFEAFWRRCKAGDNPGYPRFKSEDRYDSFTFVQSGFRLIDDRLRLSKVGDVRIKRHRPIRGEIRQVTIRRDAVGDWFACFQVLTPHKCRPSGELAVGIDVGLKSFAVLSDGTNIENPKFFKRDQRRLAKLSRQITESPPKSERSTKKQRAKNKVLRRVTNRRTDFAHQLSRRIVSAYGTICVERLDVIDMMNGNFKSANRSISDAAWSQFSRFLAYKAEDAGCQFVAVDPRNTTQMCSSCLKLVPKGLDERVHHCSHCGLEMDRDLNASLNILRLGLESLRLDAIGHL